MGRLSQKQLRFCPAFKVGSVFDVSQTDGKELPDIIVDELKGTVENYEAFFDALKQESPVPVSFEDIPGVAKGFFSPVLTVWVSLMPS